MTSAVESRVPPSPRGWRQPFGLYSATDEESAQIRAQHLRQLVRLTPVLMGANLLAGVLLWFCVGHAGGWPMVVWLLLLALVAGAGLAAWGRSRRQLPSRSSVRAYRRGSLHAAALGLCWGGAAALWFPRVGPAEQVLMATLMSGMLSAGAVALAMQPWASLIYVWLVAAGSLLALWQAGGLVFGAVAALLLSYTVIVSLTVLALSRQATALLRARLEQARQQQVVSLLLKDFEENASDALWETDADGRLLHRSPRLVELLGVPEAELARLRLPQWFASQGQDVAHLLAAWALGRPFRDLKLRLGQGEQARWWSLSAKPKSGGGWRGVIADITEAQRFENQLRLQAEHDALTGLPNRRALLGAVKAALALGRSGWLMSIDLDHFKAINDGSGHTVGDEVLRVVAERLRQSVEEGDLVARLGGDEFAVLSLNPAPRRAPQQQAAALIERLREPIHIGPKQLHLGASVGLVRLDERAGSVEELMVNADLALYDAKRSGRSRGVVYAASLGEAARRQNSIELALRDGLRAGQFELHFQPQADTRSLKPLGVEALLRWEHPELGSISPGEFIPVAERSGLIHELGEFALTQACRAAQQLPGLSMAVNVSPLQLMQADFVASVDRALSATGLDPARLHLEVTESLMLEDAQGAIKRLQALQGLGVRMALDDFGTGFSSLSYLRAFPFHTLKVDRSFVRALSEHADALAIVNTIVQMAQVLGMRTVAEGVETEQDLGAIRTIGCDEVQGYLVSRPLPLARLQDWLAGRPVQGPQDDTDSRVLPWRLTQSAPTTLFGGEL